jgi:hypothetical protein
MRTNRISAIVAAAALAALTPAAASATQGGGTVDTSYGNPQPQEDDGFPWGLLGLLGLLGLIPRKRKDNITVDNRTNR